MSHSQLVRLSCSTIRTELIWLKTKLQQSPTLCILHLAAAFASKNHNISECSRLSLWSVLQLEPRQNQGGQALTASSLRRYFTLAVFRNTWDWVGEDSLSMRSSSYIQFVIHWSNNTHKIYFSCRKLFNNRENWLNLAILAKGVPVCLI